MSSGGTARRPHSSGRCRCRSCASPRRPIPWPDLHDRLLSAPLAAPLGRLPAGSRFTAVAAGGPGGIVERPGGPDSAPGGPRRATLWESFGDHLAVTHPDGSVTFHGWRATDAALRGGGG